MVVDGVVVAVVGVAAVVTVVVVEIWVVWSEVVIDEDTDVVADLEVCVESGIEEVAVEAFDLVEVRRPAVVEMVLSVTVGPTVNVVTFVGTVRSLDEREIDALPVVLPFVTVVAALVAAVVLVAALMLMAPVMLAEGTGESVVDDTMVEVSRVTCVVLFSAVVTGSVCAALLVTPVTVLLISVLAVEVCPLVIASEGDVPVVMVEVCATVVLL